jgi:hypothetical protein
MKYILSLLFAFTVMFMGCDKDKIETIPHLNINSISPNTVNSGQIIQIKGNFTDQEGDLDSALLIYKWYDGATGFMPFDTQRYTFAALGMPDKVTQADITVTFLYNEFSSDFVTLPGVTLRDTTATLGLILIDKDGNRSDYEESDQIRLIKP